MNIHDRKSLEVLETRTLYSFAAKSKDWEHTRFYQEEQHPYRTAFQRDRDRIIHSRAFRRLKHKRQVFLISYGDHYRTRLTHTLEVSQLSRTIARVLGLNEDLCEAIALGHDLGHTPFGHIGEVVLHRIMTGADDLNGIIRFKNVGGFKHNYQSVRIIDVNEAKYAFRGLNLTAPVREGILKHTRLKRDELNYPDFKKEGLYYDRDVSITLEGQIVAVCDEIAQRTHDLEDGLRAEYVTVDQVRSLPLIQKLETSGRLEPIRDDDLFQYRNRLIRRLVDFFITDVIETTVRCMEQYHGTKEMNERLVWFSDSVDPLQEELDRFINQTIIAKASEQRSDAQAELHIRQLFSLFYQYPNLLPFYRMVQAVDAKTTQQVYQTHVEKNLIDFLQHSSGFARAVCDYIAGMTDQFAENLFAKLTTLSESQLGIINGNELGVNI